MKMAVRVLALVAVATLTVVAACGGDEPSASENLDSQDPTATSLLVETPTAASTSVELSDEERMMLFFGPFDSGRTHFSICVDGAAGFVLGDLDVERVRDALESTIPNVREDAWYLSILEGATVAEGCPDSALPLGEFIEYRTARYASIVEVASEHKVFVYYLPDDVFDATFDEKKYFLAGAEICCMTGNDVEATTAVYVRQSATVGKLGEAIMHAIGFQFYCAPGDVCPTRLPS